jgi:hypothetical protein
VCPADRRILNTTAKYSNVVTHMGSGNSALQQRQEQPKPAATKKILIGSFDFSKQTPSSNAHDLTSFAGQQIGSDGVKTTFETPAVHASPINSSEVEMFFCG